MTAKTQKSAEFRERILRAMIDIAEPVTVSEMTTYIGRELQRELNDFTARDAMRTLAAEGKLAQRVETDDERRLRFNGKTVFAGNATLYYPTIFGDTVPTRTVVSIAPGIEIKGRTTAWGRPVGSTGKKRIAARGATPKVTGLTGRVDKDAMDFLIEKLVAERTKKLQHELEQARTQLAEIRKLLS